MFSRSPSDESLRAVNDWQSLASTEHLEEAKAELKKTMTIKMMKKKEATTLRLQHKAQQETASLVKKHSEQMLQLLQSKQDELAKELEEEIVRILYTIVLLRKKWRLTKRPVSKSVSK